MRLLIEARGPNLEPAGIVEGYTEAIILPRYNGLGSWSIKIPVARLTTEVRDAWAEHGGIRVVDADQPDADPILSGPITKDQETWGESDRHGGTLTATGISDERVLDGRIVYPDPNSAWEDQGAASHHIVSTAPAEDVIHEYVRRHAGPGALPARRWPGLTLAPSFGRGGLVEGSERFANLLELCQGLALAGGTGFRIDQTDAGGLLFQQYVPVLRSDVLLAADAGTLREGTSSVEAPTLTRALVAGQGEQEERLLVERGNLSAEADWGARIERLVDARNTTTSGGLEQGGDQDLAEGGAKGFLTVVVQDTADVVFGRDYRLGDVVPYQLRGAVLEDVVREVKITAGSGRTLVQPTIGPPDASATPAMYRRLQLLERAVRSLRSN